MAKSNIENWAEYADLLHIESVEAYYAHSNICPSCCGCGDHGDDEEGRLYVCFGCGGTGKYALKA